MCGRESECKGERESVGESEWGIESECVGERVSVGE